jgi:hypothetical protein
MVLGAILCADIISDVFGNSVPKVSYYNKVSNKLLVVIFKCHYNKMTLSVCLFIKDFFYVQLHWLQNTQTRCCFSVEQVKGSEEMKEKIIAASKDARNLPDYPQELLPDYFTNSVTICDKYLNNYQESHLHTNGMLNVSFIISYNLYSGQSGY